MNFKIKPERCLWQLEQERRIPDMYLSTWSFYYLFITSISCVELLLAFKEQGNFFLYLCPSSFLNSEGLHADNAESVYLFILVLGVAFKTLNMLGKCSTIEPGP